MRRASGLIVCLALLAVTWWVTFDNPDATRRDDSAAASRDAAQSGLDEGPEGAFGVDTTGTGSNGPTDRRVVEPWPVRGRALLPGGDPASGRFVDVTLFVGYEISAEAAQTRSVEVSHDGTWECTFEAPHATVVLEVRSKTARIETDPEELRSLGPGRWLITRGRLPRHLDLELFPIDAGIDLFVVDRQDRRVIDAQVLRDGEVSGRTDRAGRLQLRVSSYLETLRVGVVADGYARTTTALEIPRAEASKNARVVLRRGLHLRGFVEDAAGVPIRDALASDMTSREVRGVRTDVQGRFTIGWLPFRMAAHKIFAEARGFLRSSIMVLRHELEEPRAGKHVITLRRGVEVFGEITTHEGAAIAGARLRVVSTPRSSEDTTAISRDEGQYAFATVASGQSVFLCRALEQPPFLHVVDVPRRATGEPVRAHRSNIRVPDMKRCSGTVSDYAQRGVAFARVRALSDPDGGGPLPAYPIAEARTGSSGTFVFDRLPRQELVFEVEHLDHGAATVFVAPSRTRLAIDLPIAAHIRVAARDARTGEPIERFEVLLDNEHSAHVVDDGGNWQSPSLTDEQKTREVTLRANGYAELSARIEPHGTWYAALRRPTTVWGRVTGSVDSRPIEDARVAVHVAPDSAGDRRFGRPTHSRAVVFTNAAGEFHVDRALPGSTMLLVSHPDFAPWRSTPFVTAPGAREEVAIELDSGVRIRGTFVDGAGKAVQSASLNARRLTRSSRRRSAPAVTTTDTRGDDHGRFSFASRVSAGRWRIEGYGTTAPGNYVYATMIAQYRTSDRTVPELRLRPTTATRVRLVVWSKNEPPPFRVGSGPVPLLESLGAEVEFQAISVGPERYEVCIDGLPAGESSLWSRAADGSWRRIGQVRITAERETTQTVQFRR